VSWTTLARALLEIVVSPERARDRNGQVQLVLQMAREIPVEPA
jgi:hypothetical protein